jgi:CubicO group peptidase (beta-lactamase class C family)
MKTITWISIVIVIGWSCNTSSGKTVAPTKEDSLEYYPPTPAKLDQQKFRRYYREVSHFFDSALVRRGFNGSILIAKEGSIIYEKYAGFADLRTKDPMTDSTALHIASSGKTFTGMAVLRMVQENKLSLNDSLQKFFPGFPYPGVTVKMLLNHRSGMPNYIYFMPKNEWKDKYVTNADVLSYLFSDKPNRTFTPGKRFSYSNTNFVLLALIIEKISGKTFPEYMQTKFFGPLGMTHTYVFTINDTAKAISSYEPNGAKWQNDFLEGTYGDKNIYTTPRDLLKWDQAFYTDQLINKELLDTAFTPYSNERPSVHNYGLAWRLLLLPNGKKVIYHNGRWHGFNAAFARLTDEKATIIVLGNKFNHNIYKSARLAYDIFGEYKQGHGNDEEENETPESGKKIATAEKSASPAARKVKNKG